MATFAENYCSCYGVTADGYVQSMFRRCLHRRAWMLTPFLMLVSPDYFMADYDLICDVGRLTRATGLAEDLADYHSHPYNRSFARRRLRLRVSVRRVTKEVHRLLPGPAAANFYDSAQPFRDGVAEDAPASKAPPHSARS